MNVVILKKIYFFLKMRESQSWERKKAKSKGMDHPVGSGRIQTLGPAEFCHSLQHYLAKTFDTLGPDSTTVKRNY